MLVHDICERDMDLIFAEEFMINPDFADIFKNKITSDLKDYKVTDAEVSRIEAGLGESDLTIILENEVGQRIGFLIEDKIDAIAMPEQCDRYIKRGEREVEDGLFSRFYVFIVAPEKYLDINSEVTLYPYKVSYQELAELFKNDLSARGRIKLAIIEQALESAHVGNNKISDEVATRFWMDFVEYQKIHYPELDLKVKDMTKTAKGDWPVYGTFLHLDNKVYIHHKMTIDVVDLTFNRLADYSADFEIFLKDNNIDYENIGATLHIAGKSLVIRLIVSAPLDFQKSFDSQVNIVEEHLSAVKKLSELATIIRREKLINFYTNIGL